MMHACPQFLCMHLPALSVTFFCMHASFFMHAPSSCMHEHACKCAKLHACSMHDACMQCMHAAGIIQACSACTHHACSACMHSLEGKTSVINPICDVSFAAELLSLSEGPVTKGNLWFDTAPYSCISPH